MDINYFSIKSGISEALSGTLEKQGTHAPSAAGQGLVDGWLEAAHMLHGGTVRLHGLHVLVQDGKNLIVQDLVFPDPVCHLLQGLEKDKGM